MTGPEHVSSLPSDPGELANSLMDQLVARAQRNLDRMRDLGDRMAAIRVTETSPDGAVTVTVDGTGALLDLELGAAIRDWTPARFDEVVVGTAQRAVAAAFARHAELVTEFNESLSGKTGEL